MKRRLLLLLAALLCSASAHDTQSAGNVQVTMTTDADDALRVQAPTSVTFLFRHAGGPLAPCRCRVLLYRGRPSARVPPLRDHLLGALDDSSGHVTFAELPAGAYTLVLDGRPQQFGDFDSFRMQYVLSAQAP